MISGQHARRRSEDRRRDIVSEVRPVGLDDLLIPPCGILGDAAEGIVIDVDDAMYMTRLPANCMLLPEMRFAKTQPRR